jgi:hypothetical protein
MIFTYINIIFWQYWGLNLVPSAHWANALQFEPHPSPLAVSF